MPRTKADDTPPDSPILGVAEIATLIGVKRNTVLQWRFRGKLPPPDYELAMGPAWKRSTIERWRKAL